jgi:molecular chaperone GrpE (heat shock protein)|tara:strand:+ start:111 stop:578 length:468 start_codon:yes stop_codon:yes gene_type:complete
MAVLATIMAANAAYGVIKQCLENGREVKDMVGHVGKFLSAEDDLKEAVKRKKNNPISAITGGSEGDWEEFQALEKIQEQRRELESWCRLYGPPGTWDRWISWQAEARKARRAAQKQREKEREEMVEIVMYAFSGVLAFGGAGAAIFAIGKYMEKW